MRSAPSTTSATLAYRLMADRLGSIFQRSHDVGVAVARTRLTYENALLAHALIVAGSGSSTPTRCSRHGLGVLDWLIDVTDRRRRVISRPIGNGWWPRGGHEVRFDQQPIEATALILAAEAAYEATGEARYRVAMERAYAWFLGDNDLRVADRRSRSAGLLRRPTPKRRQHEPGRRIDAHVADRAGADPAIAASRPPRGRPPART